MQSWKKDLILKFVLELNFPAFIFQLSTWSCHKLSEIIWNCVSHDERGFLSYALTVDIDRCRVELNVQRVSISESENVGNR